MKSRKIEQWLQIAGHAIISNISQRHKLLIRIISPPASSDVSDVISCA